MIHTLYASTHIPLPRDEVFVFFSAADNLERITPPELRFRILTPHPITIQQGTLIDYDLRLFGVPMAWRTRIAVWHPPHEFMDEQLRGPYNLWQHTHRFFEMEDGTTLMHDIVRYRLPYGLIGIITHPLVRLQLNAIFAYRRTAIHTELLTEYH